MSAIGSCVRMKTADLDRCLALAAQITTPPPPKWPWQKKPETGRDAFMRFCGNEWGDGGPERCAGITQVGAYLEAGLSRIDEHHAVVFVIS